MNDASAVKDEERVKTLFNRALKEHGSGKLDLAVATCREVLDIRSDHVGALHMIGVISYVQGQWDRAEEMISRALDIRPGMSDALNNLSLVLQVQGKVDQAIEALRKAIALKPDFPVAHSNLIYSLDHHPKTDDEVCFRERRLWNDRYARRYGALQPALKNDRNPERRLRVGYVSGDYRNHSAAFLFIPILFGHDRTRFEVVCYSGVKTPDQMTERCKRAANLWRDIAHLSDEQVAETIRSDRIDILIDLSGHSEANRLLAFARRAAPVQMTAWGYANGTGVDAMDYILTDAICVPPEAEKYYAEKPVRLPVLAVFGLPDNAPEVDPLPAKARGYFTFGSLNRTSKLTASTIALWTRVLKAAPDTRLYLKDRGFDSTAARLRLLDLFATEGIERTRIELAGGSTRMEHMRAYNNLDLALDPIPAGGGMTLAEGLWMGVPPILLLGGQLSGRGPSSIMATAGLAAFVARSEDEYVEKAVAWSKRTDELAALRAGLREQVRKSPIGDHKAYVRMVEIAYREMWRRWCIGLPPAPFEVRP